ncbi:MAG: hypothetical protein KDD62_07925 [Bdellovibrionales bacterium]|nr:hypothetical protein [Bdellovibrionales bacterium]
MSRSNLLLPVPDFFPKQATGRARRLHYQANPIVAGLTGVTSYGEPGLLELGKDWAKANNLTHSKDDKLKTLAVAIDYADTFGHVGAELVVPNAPEDGWRFGSFVLKHARLITDTMPTFDSHFVPHIFHTPMWRYRSTGKHPDPLTAITTENYNEFEPSEYACYWVGKDRRYLEQYLAHYVHKLAEERVFHIKGEDRNRPRPPLVLWPLHALMGSQGYTLFPEVEEALYLHQFARGSRMLPQVKGLDKLTEAYSPFGSEVTVDHNGDPVGRDSEALIASLLNYHAVIIGGEASSHCVAAGIYDILGRILAKNRDLASKIYILEDCMSAVPGFEAQADEAQKDFVDAGMNLVKSTDDVSSWPGPIQDVIAQAI